MSHPDFYKVPLDTRRFIVLHPKPPFVDVLLRLVNIDALEFARLDELAASWENDPRLIELVRLGGDGSAKVPYLMASGESAASILKVLREIAAPYVRHLDSLPEAMQASIHLLLSINTLPRGCENYAIPALLEIDNMHAGILTTLREIMPGRDLAEKFFADNLAALKRLDEQWQRLRREVYYPSPGTILPVRSQMEFEPIYERQRLAQVYETCVIVPPRDRELLLEFTPPVLRRPLPTGVSVPATGSVDWLLREVGKVGRHFTRSMLHMVKERLKAEELPLEVRNYRRIHEEALLIWQDYVQKLP